MYYPLARNGVERVLRQPALRALVDSLYEREEGNANYRAFVKWYCHRTRESPLTIRRHLRELARFGVVTLHRETPSGRLVVEGNDDYLQYTSLAS